MRFCTLTRVKRASLLVLFGSLAIALLFTWTRFAAAFSASQSTAADLLRLTAQFADSTRAAVALAGDLAFLHTVGDLLPQEKGFQRTQKAMGRDVEVLRRKVGRKVRESLHILVDTQANKLYVKQGLTLLWQADCSVGRGGTLTDKKTGRRWEFVTPRGQFEIRGKMTEPLWIKPDWAFVETGEAIPPPGDPSRQAKGELGAYVLNLGDGYLIHGTRDEKSLGRPASHGCVRLGRDDLQKLFDLAPVGTRVYIY